MTQGAVAIGKGRVRVLLQETGLLRGVGIVALLAVGLLDRVAAVIRAELGAGGVAAGAHRAAGLGLEAPVLAAVRLVTVGAAAATEGRVLFRQSLPVRDVLVAALAQLGARGGEQMGVVAAVRLVTRRAAALRHRLMEDRSSQLLGDLGVALDAEDRGPFQQKGLDARRVRVVTGGAIGPAGGRVLDRPADLGCDVVVAVQADLALVDGGCGGAGQEPAGRRHPERQERRREASRQAHGPVSLLSWWHSEQSLSANGTCCLGSSMPSACAPCGSWQPPQFIAWATRPRCRLRNSSDSPAWQSVHKASTGCESRLWRGEAWAP